MKKEKVTRKIAIVVQQRVFDALEKSAEKDLKTVSQIIRELIINYLVEQKGFIK